MDEVILRGCQLFRAPSHTHAPSTTRLMWATGDLQVLCGTKQAVCLEPFMQREKQRGTIKLQHLGDSTQATLLHANRVGVVGVLHRVVDFRTLQPAVQCSLGHPEGGGV